MFLTILRSRLWTRAAQLVFVATVPLLAGCAPKQTPISGRVLLDGKPLPGGRVTFRPENSKFNSVSVELNEQGHYEAVLPLGMIHVNIDNRELEPRPARSGVSIVLPGMSPE